METLVSILQRILKFRDSQEKLMFDSPAYGIVEFDKFIDGGIQVIDYTGETFKFDSYGRIHPKGRCLLFPETKETWDIYLKKIIDKYYDSKLRIGDVCLVKDSETSDWVLAIYDGKLDGRYKVKRGKDIEILDYCISYVENSSYLGRAMFPDWMIPEEEN